MNIICPNCQTRYRNIPDKFNNRSVKCKKCQHSFLVNNPTQISEPQETRLASDVETAAAAPQETVLAQAPQQEVEISGDSVHETQLASSDINRPDAEPLETVLAAAEEKSESESYSKGNDQAVSEPSLVSQLLDSGSEQFINQRQSSHDTMPDKWRIGEVLLELYEVKSVLGEGQFGKVYQVRHRNWNLDLALKSPKLKALSAGSENIEKEAETWVNLDLHPNIVNCYYVRRINGIPQIFSEYVDGGDLKKLIVDKKLYLGNQQDVMKNLLDIAIQFAWGLHYAHEQGLIHQDIKPANIMVTNEGVIKVTDFGLAKAGAMANISGQDHNQTMVIAGMGMTPAYASPEQLAGHRLTRRTDIWSWGVCILEMLLGYCSWEAGAVAPGVFESYLNKQLDDEPEIGTIPDSMQQLLMSCFNEEEERRPSNLQEIADALIAIYRDEVGIEYPRSQPKSGQGTASSLNNQAISLLDLGLASASLKLWKQALDIDPRHFESTYNLSLYAWKYQGLEQSDVISSIENFEMSERVIQGLARVYLQFGLFNKTIELLNPESDNLNEFAEKVNPEFCKEIGLALCAKYRLAKEISVWKTINKCLKKAVSGKITDPYVNTAYTVSLQKCDENKEAADFFKAATSIGVIPRQLKHAVALFMPGYEIIYRLPKKNVHIIAFTHKSEFFVYSHEKQIVIWSLKNNQLVRLIKGHTSRITNFKIDESQQYIISGSEQGNIRIWDFETGQSIKIWKAHHSSVTGMDVSPCGRYLLTASKDKVLCLWKLDEGKKAAGFFGEGHDSEITELQFSPDGKSIISASRDKIIRLWDVENGKTQKILSGHDMPVTSVQWITNTRVISGSSDKSLRIWNIETSKCEKVLKGHKGEINQLRVAYNKQYAVTASSDGTLRFWDINSGSSHIICQFPKPISYLALDDSEQFTLMVTPSGIAMAENLNPFRYQAPYLFSEPESALEVDQLQRLYQEQLSSGLSFKNQNNPLKAMECFKKARSIKGYEREFTAFKYWSDLYKWLPRIHLKDTWKLCELKNHQNRITSLVFTNDNQIISAAKDNMILSWDLDSRKPVAVEFQCETNHFIISITADSKGLLVASGQTVQLIDIKTGEKLSIFKEHQGNVKSITITADGRFALSADDRCGFFLWRLLTGELISSLAHKKWHIDTIAVTPDGRYAITGHQNNNILSVWDLQNGQVVSELKEHEKNITSITVSSDGQYVLSGSADGNLRLWKIKSSRKKSVRAMRQHSRRIHQVAMDFQNRLAISASEDRTVKFWNLVNGECLFSFESPHSEFTTVALSKNGQYAVAGDMEGTIWVWCLDWMLDKKQYVEWDNSADIYITNYLSSHRVREPHKELNTVFEVLKLAGFGWLDRNEIGLRLVELAQGYQTTILPGSKVKRESLAKKQEKSRKTVTLYVLALLVMFSIFVAIFSSDEPDNDTVDHQEVNENSEQTKVVDEDEEATIDSMLYIASGLVSINQNVAIVNNRIVLNSLTIPLDLEQLKEMLELEDEDLIDSWGQAYRYKGVNFGGFKGRIVLRSAGMDKKFETEDDLFLNGFPYVDSLAVRKNKKMIVKFSDVIDEYYEDSDTEEPPDSGTDGHADESDIVNQSSTDSNNNPELQDN